MPRMTTKSQSKPQNEATPKSDVHHDRAGRADQHRAFAAEAVGEQAVDDLPAGIGEERGRDDRAHLRFAETELLADRAVRDREIVAAHVERGVEQADEDPVQAAPRAKTWRMRAEFGVKHERAEHERPRRGSNSKRSPAISRGCIRICFVYVLSAKMKPIRTINFVARQTGLTVHTIRVWEKRYGAVRPGARGATIAGFTPRKMSNACAFCAKRR